MKLNILSQKSQSNAVKYIGLLALFLGLQTSTIHAQSDLKLWYKQPAIKWTDALPIGNGRLGGMIFGGVQEDRIQFNENTFWTGGPREYQRNGAYKYLPQIRQLLAEGKQKEAESLAMKEFMGTKSHEFTYAAGSIVWVKKMRGAKAISAYKLNSTKLKNINLPTEQGWEVTPGFEGLDGAVWFTKTFDVPASWKGKNLTLSLGRVRDVDFTYVNNKQVGTTGGTTYRKYIIPAKDLHAGKNTISIQVLNFNDKGGLTSNAKELKVYPEGDQNAAITLSGEWKYFIQDAKPPAFPKYNADYQPFGDVYLQFPKADISNYIRDLDISNATAHVTYKANGVTYTREYFSSAPDQVMAIHLTADKPGSISLKALLKALHTDRHTRKIDNNTLALYVRPRDGVLQGVSYLKVKNIGGKVVATDNNITISHANEVTLYLTAATNYKNYHDVSGNPEAICKRQQAAIATKSYAAIRDTHIADYQKYFNTFSLDLGRTASADLPTDERILQFRNTPDPSFVTLYTQYGRYLFISSSRPGNGPSNLQGIWNDLLTPPWGSKYTTNINLQMNYWPAEPLNLSALSEPFFSIVDDLAKTGKATAKEHYNAPGWVLHHNTDLWRGTAPVNASNHGIWQTGGAWLCHQLWEHYLFTQDINFLRNRAYPEMKGAAEFFVHNLVKDPKTGYLISSPSNSPEHGGLVAGPTMDHQIIRDLFKNCEAAAKALEVDNKFADTLKTMYKQIAPNKIGRAGQLQEWLEDKDDTTDTHRHVSHMWGVYPGNEINMQTPEMLKAATKSMQFRGDDGTGWSIAWKVNIWARMHQGDHAWLMFTKLLSPADVVTGKEKGGVYHNLFDAHPPFQIDGNFGGAAGISEMLVQSQGEGIELLPALPTALPNGNVKGLCARGGFVLNFSWENGVLKEVQVLSKTGAKCRLIYKDKTVNISTQIGKSYTFNGDLKKL
ncbi:glycoside hydrolase family 95 protein [Mucilaginibacter boryungensis]|uniref:Glycoside hydrolase N-terminal domain-containing protein n=1 Tax=Mucilaginibacter boryungensis TaxID=768480 RepID=A0ABR9XDW0_9SPHI|nr:glycoside hydrolase N-terminal domain-containing protein [Mucilaginibacter boryungensis]MBE9665248.1 glycoside hydrolase N-terminal domain-containing protein [Mucilaginibacter boryungensis]